ncbi:MAG: DNA-3-methyladenine glycosylase 2 family protein [Candidatus Sungiibacteriota bacterium]
MNNKAEDHKRRVAGYFRREDPVLHGVLAGMPWEMLRPTENPAGYFNRLCREIISQQLGSGAARAIVARFRAVFPRGHATPARVRALSEEQLRGVGMSWAKARSLRDLAARVVARDIDFKKFAVADDEQVITELVRVKGIGRWTAEMFLIFTLGREDVFSFGDFALRKSLKRLYGAQRTRTQKSMERIVNRWTPYRSYASLALWHYIDNNK